MSITVTNSETDRTVFDEARGACAESVVKLTPTPNGSKLARPGEYVAVADLLAATDHRKILFISGALECGKRELLKDLHGDEALTLQGGYFAVRCRKLARCTQASIMEEILSQVAKQPFVLDRPLQNDLVRRVMDWFLSRGIRSVSFIDIHHWGAPGIDLVLNLHEAASECSEELQITMTSNFAAPILFDGLKIPHTRFLPPVSLQPMTEKEIKAYFMQLSHPFPTLAKLKATPVGKAPLGMVTYVEQMTGGNLGQINDWCREIKVRAKDAAGTSDLRRLANAVFARMDTSASDDQIPAPTKRARPETFAPHSIKKSSMTSRRSRNTEAIHISSNH